MNQKKYNESPESFFLKKLFNDLNTGKVTYAVLRHYSTLPEQLDGGDIDIYVKTGNSSLFFHILFDAVSAYGGKCIGTIKGRTRKLNFAGRLPDGRYWGVEIDACCDMLHFHDVSLWPVDDLEKQIGKFGNILVLNDDFGAMISFLKELLNNYRCKETYRLAAAAAVSRNPAYYRDMLSNYYNPEFADKVLALLSAGSPEPRAYVVAAGIGRKHLLRQDSWGNKYTRFSQKIARCFQRDGIAVAFLGCDGAGKSTIINGIKEPLNNALHGNVFYEHMRPNMIPSIAGLFGKKKKNEVNIDPHGKKPSGVIGSFIRLAYYSVDYIVGYWVKIYPAMLRRPNIYIFDRYFYDYLVDQRRGRINLPVWVLRPLFRIFPHPDLVICLGADPEVIHRRKPELSLEEVKRQVIVLKELSNSLDRAVWVDTGCLLEQSVDHAMSLIVEKMVECNRSKLNGVFYD